MKNILHNPWAIFFSTALIINAALWLYPVGIFNGLIINGIQEVPVKLALSYFIGIGIDPKTVADGTTFSLTNDGKFFALTLCLFIPIILGYRTHIKNKNR